METSSYVASWPFEGYINMARGGNWDDPADRNSHMSNLIDKELDKSNVAHLKHERLLQHVKNRISSATFAALQRPISSEDKAHLKKLLTNIQGAFKADQLINLCNQGMDILRKYMPN